VPHIMHALTNLTSWNYAHTLTQTPQHINSMLCHTHTHTCVLCHTHTLYALSYTHTHMCVCVCVWERERERECIRETERERRSKGQGRTQARMTAQLLVLIKEVSQEGSYIKGTDLMYIMYCSGRRSWRCRRRK
jgi:hypothetical protein